MKYALKNSLKHEVDEVEFIWKCNLNTRDMDFLAIQNTWWYGLIKSLCKLNFIKKPKTVSIICQQTIWFNSHIKIAGEPCFFKSAYNAGLRTISDLLYEDLSFKSTQELVENWPQLTWLNFENILSAIPSSWKTILNQNVRGEDDTLLFDRLEPTTKPSKLIYFLLIESPNVIRESYEKWNLILHLDYTRYQKAFDEIYTITNCTKLRDFQYRLLHKRVPSNKELYKWKIIASDKCSFCDEQDDILHTLYRCGHINKLWKQFMTYAKTLSGIVPIELSEEAIILNHIHPKIKHIVNFATLVFKQLIYRKKCKNERLYFVEFEKELLLIKQIEHYNAIKKQ